ncbi:MAG: malonyl-CoA synthase [Acidiferrobacterales bacterium]
MNIVTLFESRYPSDPSRTFIETASGHIYSYSNLEAASARIANFLINIGVNKGDRVVVQVDKSPEVLFLYLATLRMGAIYLPLNTAYTDRELNYFLVDASPVLLVCRPEQVSSAQALATKNNIDHCLTLGKSANGSLLAGAADCSAEFKTVECDDDDIAVILYTSGTTGQPKGAMISHGNLAANGLTLHKFWQWRPGDILLHVLPIFHIHGLFVACHCVLLNGSKMLFLEKFDVMSVMENLPRSTVMMGVPTFYVRLLANKALTRERCKNMRLFICGSAPLPEHTFNEFLALTGHTILERYGMTETGMNTSNPVDGKRLPGTVGLALPGVSVRIVDNELNDLPANEIGNLLVKGNNVFRGYWNMPEKTKEEFTDEGDFRTGDLARMDKNGYVSIVGRSKDLIISGGLNVYPKEIEYEIDQLEAVTESAVIGLPHVDFGEAVTAIIVLEKDSTLKAQEIMDHLDTCLANFKLPKRIYFVDSLPRNTMGKVQKNILRQQFTE